MLSDDPLSVPLGDGGEWTPQNFDLGSAGQIPMRQALYQSRNIATVRLGLELGEGTVIDMAKRLGITTPIPQYPSIFLGAAEVYPIQMVAAYSAFATLGNRATPFGIVRVENTRGDVLWTPTPSQFPALSAEEAWLMVDMMKDVVRRGTAASAVGAQFSIPAGGKTGTTNDGTDVWYVGYTSDLVAGVWMGFDRPKKIKSNAQGGQLAGPAWTAFMKDVYRRKPAPPDWPRPNGIVQASIDRSTGLLAGPYCPAEVVMTEFYIVGTEPARPCDVHTPYAGAYYDTLGTGGYYPPGTRPQIPAPAMPMPSPAIPPAYPPTSAPSYPPPANVPATPLPRDTVVRPYPPAGSQPPTRTLPPAGRRLPGAPPPTDTVPVVPPPTPVDTTWPPPRP
jgi:penicillin-binding protein 1A